MTQRFTGKVVLVTGTARGIGKAVAARLADEGAMVVASVHRSDGHGASDDGYDVIELDVGDADAITRRRGRLGAVVNVASIHAAAVELNAAVYAAAKAALASLIQSVAIGGGTSGPRANVILPGAIDTPMLWANPNVRLGQEPLDPAELGRPGNVAGLAAFSPPTTPPSSTAPPSRSTVAGWRAYDRRWAEAGWRDHQGCGADRMSQGIDEVVQSQLGDLMAQAGRYGGSGGQDGSGLPTGEGMKFAWSTGIECSYPTIDDGEGGTLRRDMLEECGHYGRYEEDFALVRDLGLRSVRYGLPYHRVNPSLGRYDWSFADPAMAALKASGIIPILDMLHFGLPDWLGGFDNPELPVAFADYCGAVARRYPWVRFYTAVNEIYVTAKFSGMAGAWNERGRSDRAFVTALKHLVAANMTGCAAIVRERPDAVFIASETAEYTHELSPVPSTRAVLENELKFASLDLLYGRQPSAPVALYLLENGMTRGEYDWFMSGQPPGHQVMGNDYYGRNELMRLPSGEIVQGEDVFGWYQITKSYYERYKKPVMHTETNVFDPDAAPAWLWKQWANVMRMRADGVPVVGFTWYSLTDQIDWDIGLREKRGTVNACGLYDLDRKPRPVAAAYRELLGAFGQISSVAGAELFALSAEPARLKVQS